MTQDWKVLLSNGVPRDMQPYTQRMAEQRYQVNVPYANNVRTESNARYRDAGIKVRRSSERAFPKVLARPATTSKSVATVKRLWIYCSISQ